MCLLQEKSEERRAWWVNMFNVPFSDPGKTLQLRIAREWTRIATGNHL